MTGRPSHAHEQRMLRGAARVALVAALSVLALEECPSEVHPEVRSATSTAQRL